MVPETGYARSGKANIAHQVVGDGPLDQRPDGHLLELATPGVWTNY